jgi:hypothetical protein
MARFSADHDLIPFLQWWETLPPEEKQKLLAEIEAMMARRRAVEGKDV